LNFSISNFLIGGLEAFRIGSYFEMLQASLQSQLQQLQKRARINALSCAATWLIGRA
jgi:hypothetical protein